MTEAQIIKDAIEKHGLKLDPSDLNLLDLVRYVRHVGYNEGYNSIPWEQGIFSPEQLERYRAAFRCLELAKAELPNGDLISIACDYGAGINLTREECEKLLNMKVRDVINLEI